METMSPEKKAALQAVMDAEERLKLEGQNWHLANLGQLSIIRGQVFEGKTYEMAKQMFQDIYNDRERRYKAALADLWAAHERYRAIA